MTLMGSSQNLVRPIISSRMMAALLTRMSTLALLFVDLRRTMPSLARRRRGRRGPRFPCRPRRSPAAVSWMVPASADAAESLVRPVT